MSVPILLPDALGVLPREPFDRAQAHVDEWRGRCQNSLALGEAAATRCLQALAQAPDRGKKVTLPPLVGARYDAVAALLGDGGAFAAEAGKTVATLKKWREFDRLRIAFCHGTGEISLDLRGRWTLSLSVLAIRSGVVSPDVIWIRESEAEATSDELVSTVQRLTAQLDGVANRVRQSSAVAD